MKRRIFFYVPIVILLAFIGISIFTSRVYPIFLLQEWLDVPGSELRVGRAIISKPRNWMLWVSRKHANEKILFFGMFPEWTALEEVRGPTEPFYTFKVLDKYQVVSRIDLLEASVEQSTKLAAYIQNLKEGNVPQTTSKWRFVRVKQWDALFSRVDGHETAIYVDIPELKLSIRLSTLSILDSIDIREAPVTRD